MNINYIYYGNYQQIKFMDCLLLIRSVVLSRNLWSCPCLS